MRARDETIACSVGIDDDSSFGAVTPPIHLSANYSFAGFREPRAYDYSRSGNPTRDQLAEALTKLERGAGAIVTSSGMSAIQLVLSLVPTGALVVAPHDCYGGTWRLLHALSQRKVIDVAFADLADPEALAKVFGRRPFLVWIETPSNPLMRITDMHIFPNVVFLPMYGNAVMYRARPSPENDPDWSIFDMYAIRTYAEGHAPPRWKTIEPKGELSDKDTWFLIPSQDFTAIVRQQRGLKSSAMKSTLMASHQESLILNMHRELDRFLTD